MEYLAYLLALKDLADCPIVDKSVLALLGGKSKQSMTIADRRAALKGKAR